MRSRYARHLQWAKAQPEVRGKATFEQFGSVISRGHGVRYGTSQSITL